MNFIYYSLAIASITLTISQTAVFKPLRDNVPTKWLKKLIHCPYCLAHYFALFAALYLFPWDFNLLIKIMALVALSSIVSLPILLYLELLDE